jgi:hypothetical protein
VMMAVCASTSYLIVSNGSVGWGMGHPFGHRP